MAHPSTESSRIAYVIATANRREILEETIQFILSGTVVPAQIIVVGAKQEDLPRNPPACVTCHVGCCGLTQQRNLGVSALSDNVDIAALIDDDVFVHEAYSENMLSIFDQNPNTTLVMGHILQNGDISLSDARKLILEHQVSAKDRGRYVVTTTTWGGVYGANMVMRKSFLDHTKFDERLVLYALMEDVDIGTQARKSGDVGYYFGAPCVHLRTPGGRISAKKLGFSEVMNPVYLARKGSVPWGVVIIRRMIRQPLVNLARTILHQDREKLERFKGNMIALFFVLRGKIQPEHAINV